MTIERESIDNLLSSAKGVVRMFLKECGGKYPFYVYILNVYKLGDAVFLKVSDDLKSLDFRLVNLDDVDTIEYYKSDQDGDES